MGIFTDTVSVSSVTAGIHNVYIDFVQNGTGPSTNVCNLYWFQFGDSRPWPPPRPRPPRRRRGWQ